MYRPPPSSWPPASNSDFHQPPRAKNSDEGWKVPGYPPLVTFPEADFTQPPPGLNKILIFTIHNPKYPVDTQTLYRVCLGQAIVHRIVILRGKQSPGSALKAMVEFGTIEEALGVKNNLSGREIFDGACTMQITFAFNSVFKLRVYKNDCDTWDFTGEATRKRPRSSFSEPPPKRLRQDDSEGKHYSVVIMAYDLNPEMANPERLFNLLCVYGDVVRVKFLQSKSGCAMVEMATVEMANRVIQFLHMVPLFGNNVTLKLSHKSSCITDKPGSKVVCLANGAKAFQDFSQSKLHRFSDPYRAAKNKNFANASPVLYFWSLPAEMVMVDDREGQIGDLFVRLGAAKPKTVLVFVRHSEDAPTSGLVEFSSVDEAVSALALCNHATVSPPEGSGAEKTLKLGFSLSQKIEKKNHSDGNSNEDLSVESGELY